MAKEILLVAEAVSNEKAVPKEKIFEASKLKIEIEYLFEKVWSKAMS